MTFNPFAKTFIAARNSGNILLNKASGDGMQPTSICSHKHSFQWSVYSCLQWFEQQTHAYMKTNELPLSHRN